MRSVARVRCGVLAVAFIAGSALEAFAGHEVGFYPSYYPHEIRLEALDPAAAIARFEDKELHAYVGVFPGGEGRLPDYVNSVTSLESFLVLDFNPASHAWDSDEDHCAAARSVLAGLRDGAPEFFFHPYAVTPYHADYLHHLDRIADSKAGLAGESAAAADLKIQVRGAAAEAIVGDRWKTAVNDWDASLEAVRVDDLIAETGGQFDAWVGSPWAKEGWYQAYRLLAPALAGTEDAQAADDLYGRLMRGEYLDLAARIELERRLLAALSSGCRRLVVGYMLRREFFSEDDSDGIENIAYDSQHGMNAPVFIRTVKLKDYPWNGELLLGMAEEPAAAWNPVAGFSDAPGRLIWSALGDPALLRTPYNASWIPNRLDFTVTSTKGQSGGLRVPADTVRPEAGSGALQSVGDAAFASAQVVYRMTASPFLDGSDTEIADLLYPYVVAYRWGARSGSDDAAYDPHVAAAIAELRDRLVGIRAVRVDQTVNRIAPDVQIVQQIPVIEVYLREISGDEQQVAALAPPWSTVPWHLLVLLEEAVLRGEAAFSEREAERLGVAWLDLVRDPALHARLMELIAGFEEEGYRPTALEPFVDQAAATRRWRALREFGEENGHLLVTNGPYRLADWDEGAVVLRAVRDATYPMGFGTFDQFVLPLKALVRDVSREDDRIVVRVDAEKTIQVGRRYESTVAPLSHTTSRGVYGTLVISRYILLGPDGGVVRADKMQWEDDGRFVVDLPDELPPGRYTLLVAVYLDGNSLDPATGMIAFEAEG